MATTLRNDPAPDLDACCLPRLIERMIEAEDPLHEVDRRLVRRARGDWREEVRAPDGLRRAGRVMRMDDGLYELTDG